MTRPLLILSCIAVLAVSPAEAQYAQPSLAASAGVHVSPDTLHPTVQFRPLTAHADLRPPLLPSHAASSFPPLRSTSMPLSLEGRYTNRHANHVTIRYATGLPEASSSDNSGRTLLVVGLSTLAATGVAALVLLVGNDDDSGTPPIAGPPGRP